MHVGRMENAISGTCRAKGPSLKRSWRSWIPPMSRTPSDSPSRSAVMPTRRQQSREASPRRSTDMCLRLVGAVRERLPPRFVWVIDAFRHAFPLDAEH